MTTEAPLSFATAAAWRQWLGRHHATAREAVVVLPKKSSGQPGPTYAELLDDALCFGWIDGVRKGLDPHRYTIRFAPRRPNSIWSLVNIRHAERLIAAGRMQPPGLAAFRARSSARTGVYSFENKPEQFPPALGSVFRAHAKAWAFFAAQPPGYRRTTTWWVVSAKRASTQQRRLERLIAVSAAGGRIDFMAPFGK